MTIKYMNEALVSSSTVKRNYGTLFVSIMCAVTGHAMSINTIQGLIACLVTAHSVMIVTKFSLKIKINNKINAYG